MSSDFYLKSLEKFAAYVALRVLDARDSLSPTWSTHEVAEADIQGLANFELEKKIGSRLV